MSLAPGDRVERYVIEQLLGAGGMGEVYRAYDERLHRRVALKILHEGGPRRDGSPGSSGKGERMLREARAAAALDHPNVVAVFDVGRIETADVDSGATYIAMELIKGKPLRAYVGDASASMESRVLWLRQVALALAAAHAAGLVHRDVKPENVMIRDDGHVKVLDFGIAKVLPAATALPPLTTEGTLLGTPLYMSPEQLRGEPIDGRADQFSWGVMAYELLTGSPPWSTDGGAVGVAAQILLRDPSTMPELPNVPRAMTLAIRKALAKPREDRFASMGELVVALDGQVSALANTGAISAPGENATGAARSAPPNSQSAAASANPSMHARTKWIAWLAIVVVIVGGVAVFLAIKVPAWGVRGDTTGSATAGASDTPSSAPFVVSGCASHKECVASHGGAPYACRARDKTCVPMASEDCEPLFEPGDLEAEDTLWLGAILPKRGANAELYGLMNVEAVDFARHEIAHATRAIELPNGPRRVRPIAVVMCDDTVDAMRAATHLVDDVGVPAILGFGGTMEVVKLAGTLLTPRGVLAVSTLTMSPRVTRLPQPPGLPRMVWSTNANFDVMADATAQFITHVLEPRKTQKTKTRLALVRDDPTNSLSFAEKFYRSSSFNGKSAVDNGDDYRELTLSTRSPPKSEVANVAVKVAAQSPTFVVVFVSEPGPLIESIEAHWSRASPRPTYVIANGLPEGLAHLMGQSREARERFLSVASFSNFPENAHFVIRFNQTHERQVTRIWNSASSYDGFYILAYASFALGRAEVTGESLARAFPRLVPPGRPIEVGPSQILEAIAELSTGGRIDLAGTNGPLDFDIATGEPTADFALVCPAVDGKGHTTTDVVESGVVFRARSKTIEGVMRCP